MKNISLILFLGVLLAACNPKAKMVEEAFGKMEDMSQIGTVEYTITKLIIANDNSLFKFGDRKIVFSCKATMKAGIDLKDFSKEDVEITNNGKNVTLNLPYPKVLAFNMPADQVKLEYSKVSGMRDGYNTEERNELLKQGEAAILSDASTIGIIEDAKKNATDFFTMLLAHCQFENINVCFKDTTTVKK